MGAGALRLEGTRLSDWLLLFDLLRRARSGSLADEWMCKPRGQHGWTHGPVHQRKTI